MHEVSFSQALRAELDAVLARYEAMVRAQHAAMMASHERDVQASRAELAALRKERDEAVRRLDDASQRLARMQAEVELRDREIVSLRDKVDKERRKATEASSRAAESLAEARLQIGELNARLDGVAEESRVFEEVFAGEVAFVEACLPIAGSPLLEAVRQAAGIEITMAPSVYGALKQERLDALLTRVVRERGRTVTALPLDHGERTALEDMAAAAGCELIEPALGSPYVPDEMDKAATTPDPSEEGNVLACLMPGLRLRGTEGALVFPKVKVAVG